MSSYALEATGLGHQKIVGGRELSIAQGWGSVIAKANSLSTLPHGR